MVAFFNKLRKLAYEQFTEALFLLEKIYNLEDEPNDAKAYKEEGYDAGKQSINGHVKHNVWPVPVPPMH